MSARKPIYERRQRTADTWSELCEAAAALGVAFARFKLALDAHAEIAAPEDDTA